MKKTFLAIIAICFALSLFGCGSDKAVGSFTEISYDACQEMFENEETFIMIVSQTTCEMCKQYKETIKEYVKNNKVNIVYLEADKDIDAFEAIWGVYFPEVDETPTTMLVVNGVVEDMVVGTLNADQISLLLKRNDMGLGSLSEISYEKAKEWFEEDRSFVLMVSQTTCPVCKEYKESLREFIKNYDLNMVYVEADRDLDAFDSLIWNDYLPDVSDTPTTCIVKNGEVIDSVVGALEEEQLLALLERHDVFVK